MATCAGIAVKTEKGYRTIYCHNDGNPSYMLKMLRRYYNSEFLATKLVNLGNASSIHERLEPLRNYHTFDNPEDKVCVFYHRDRQDPWDECEPELYQTKKELAFVYYYFYVFDGQCWTGYRDGRKITIYL